MQNEYMFDHPVGFKVSTQVTVVVKMMDEEKNPPILDQRAFMVSDVARALKRDDVFGKSSDKNLMCARIPERHEQMPTFITKGEKVEEFD